MNYLYGNYTSEYDVFEIDSLMEVNPSLNLKIDG